MIVNGSFYDYYTTVDGYFIKGTSTIVLPGKYYINLYKVTDGHEEVIQYEEFNNNDIVQLSFDDESEYSLEVTEDDGGGTLTTVAYNIKYFPTLKDNILKSMRLALCNDCKTIRCCNGVNKQHINTILNISQFSTIGSSLYRDMLFSTSFELSPLTTTDDFYNTNGNLLLAKFKLLSDQLTNSGSIPFSNYEFALNLALLYIILYNAELTYIGYGYGGLSNSILDAQIKALKSTFDIDSISTCYTDLNISLTDLLYDDYSNPGTSVPAAYYVMNNVVLNNGYNPITHGQSSIAKSVEIFINGWSTSYMWSTEIGNGLTDASNQINVYNPAGTQTNVKIIIGF